jgi:hypothetical protein
LSRASVAALPTPEPAPVTIAIFEWIDITLLLNVINYPQMLLKA